MTWQCIHSGCNGGLPNIFVCLLYIVRNYLLHNPVPKLLERHVGKYSMGCID